MDRCLSVYAYVADIDINSLADKGSHYVNMTISDSIT